MQPPRPPRNQTPRGYYLRAKSTWIITPLGFIPAVGIALLIDQNANPVGAFAGFIIMLVVAHQFRSFIDKEHADFTRRAQQHRSKLSQEYQASLTLLSLEPSDRSNYFTAQQNGTNLHKFTSEYPQVEPFSLQQLERDITLAVARAKL